MGLIESHSIRLKLVLLPLMALALTARPCGALVIDGALNASLDQPRINAALTLPGDPNNPLSAMGVDIFGQPIDTFNIQAFYDTGASGVLLSKETTDALGVPRDPGVLFEDVGVGGSEAFDVSMDVNVHLAPMSPLADIDNAATFTTVYDQVFGPIRTQVNQHTAQLFPLDVFGMPVFEDKTVVMDVRPPNTLLGLIETTVYDSGSVPASVPATQLHVPMDYGDFSRFTQTTGGAPPTLAQNPFVGPNPAGPPPAGAAATPPGVRATFDGQTVEASWLFDTGAAASAVSLDVAAGMGVTYVPNTYNTGNPQLQGLGPNDETFVLSIGGVGGTLTVAGFFLQELVLPTLEGQDIVFRNAPVMVADIILRDPITNDMLSLDGVLGMNFFVASAMVDLRTGGFPTDFRSGAFEFLVFDQPSGILGVTVNPAVPEPSAGAMIVGLFGVIVLRRRRTTHRANEQRHQGQPVLAQRRHHRPMKESRPFVPIAP